MTERLILNQSQARAIYDAMCALNNVDGLVMVQLPNGRVQDVAGAGIMVTAYAMTTEYYPDQAAFAAAYDL